MADLPAKLTINGVIYRHDAVNDKAMSLLAEVYNALWAEGYYDPLNESTGKFARPLAQKMQDANAILKFRE